MIRKLNHTNVFVLDQDRAKAFYTEKLGLEVRNDSVLDGFRWLTVGPKDQPDLGILLAYPAPPQVEHDGFKIQVFGDELRMMSAPLQPFDGHFVMQPRDHDLA